MLLVLFLLLWIHRLALLLFFRLLLLLELPELFREDLVIKLILEFKTVKLFYKLWNQGLDWD